MSPGDAPPDDPSIADEVALWRRVHPDWMIVDYNQGSRRLSSQAFQNQRGHDAFSVCISCDAAELGAGPTDLLVGHSGYGVASFPAGLARELEQGVVRVPEEGELAHGHVIGRKTKRHMRGFADRSILLVEPQ